MKTKILFVCLGNICRSPMAEGVFEKLLKEHNLEDKFEYDSCGTSRYHIGELPDPRAREEMKINGVFLTHKARQLSMADYFDFDIILAMDKTNLADILENAPGEDYPAKIKLMRDYDSNPENLEVPDPWYGGQEGFTEVYEMLLRCNKKFLEELIKN